MFMETNITKSQGCALDKTDLSSREAEALVVAGYGCEFTCRKCNKRFREHEMRSVSRLLKDGYCEPCARATGLRFGGWNEIPVQHGAKEVK